MKNNYKFRLETFCMECEMGEARLFNQQKFAKDLRKLFAEVKSLENKISSMRMNDIFDKLSKAESEVFAAHIKK